MLVNPQKAFQSKSSLGKAKAGNSFVSMYVDLTSVTERGCQGIQSTPIDLGPQMELLQVVLAPYIKYYLNQSLLPIMKQGREIGCVSNTVINIE